MNRLRNSDHAADPPSVLRKDMKTICAWCNKVILDGPGEKLSHGICEDCEKAMAEELDRAKREQDHFKPCHEGNAGARSILSAGSYSSVSPCFLSGFSPSWQPWVCIGSPAARFPGS